MNTTYRRGFTLIEIMVVLCVIGILIVGLYASVQPYMMRSRDTKRVGNMFQYSNILEAYEKNFDTFPSNFGSGGNSLNEGYCLSELGKRTNIGSDKDMQFGALNQDISSTPRDPLNLDGIYPCGERGSYFYSRLKYGADSEVAIVAGRMEIRTSGNYGTGYELKMPSKADAIINAQKSSISDTAPDQLFVVAKTR